MTKFITDIETLGLSGISRNKDTNELKIGKIISIALLDVETCSFQVFAGEDEKKLLEDFWKAIENSDQILGFNIRDFDLPFILSRSFALGVPVVKGAFQDAIDLRYVINPYHQFPTGRLRDYALLLGLTPETHNGSEMEELYKQGRWEEIKAHNLEDVQLTQQVYKRAMEVGLL